MPGDDQIEAKVKELKSKRATAKAKITRQVNNLSQIQAEEVKNKSKIITIESQLDKGWDDFNQHHEEIITVLDADEEKCNPHFTEYDEVAEKYENAKATIYDLLHGQQLLSNSTAVTSPSNVSVQSNVQTNAQVDEVKLPRINLPIFSGNIEEWTAFRDQFRSAVHQKQTLSKAQKLNYLKGCLRGQAKSLISYMQTTDSNYDEAWKILEERYQHTREIVNAHLRKLFSQPKATNEAESLRQLITVTKECARSIDVMGVDAWHATLNFIVCERLDSQTRADWGRTLQDDKIPKHECLMAFLENRAREMLAEERSTGTSTSIRRSSEPNSACRANTKTGHCAICGGEHPVSKCSTFIKYSIDERWKAVRKHHLCANCLKEGHRRDDCKAGKCRECHGMHHSLLHNPERKQTTAHVVIRRRETLLPTAIVKIKDSKGQIRKCRALLDEGSQINFITSRCASLLQLDTYRNKTEFNGVGGKRGGQAKLLCTIVIMDEETCQPLEALILNKVTGQLPPEEICGHENWDHLQNLELSDPEWYKPGPVDIILGAGAVSLFRREGIKRGHPNTPVAQSTAFGWVVYGYYYSQSKGDAKNVNHSMAEINNSLQRLWEIEQVSERNLMTPEEKACEAHFQANTKRDDRGRYIVRLPIKENAVLGESRHLAVQRFFSLEKKFEKDADLKARYVKNMKEFIDLGHIEPVPDNEMPEGPVAYLPHHAVIREDHVTTKLRPVFDASATTTNGLSLNQILMNGPKIQDDIFNILLRFRTYNIAMMADIEKMFRKIIVDPKDRNYQRILWRENANEPLREYRLTTVAFGQKSSTYLAARVLKQLAEDERHCYPKAADVAQRDFYVDDLSTGERTVKEGIQLQQQLSGLLRAGGFELRKWASNSQEVLEAIPQEQRASIFQIDYDDPVNALGTQWQTITDEFSFKINLTNHARNTKRSISSDAARLYDPLGWLTPVTIQGKIMLQRLWKENIDWDEQVPSTLDKEWQSYIIALPEIEKIKIPRLLAPQEATDKILCGFSDASETAYAAVVYLRCKLEDGQVQVRLITAKSKVTPLKPMSMPRLELTGALLLAKLLAAVSKVYNIEKGNIHAWTDSTVALAWIRGEPSRWRAFVAHRVAEIQEIIPEAHWHHVEGTKNPADCASRGIHPSQFQNFSLWWDGPEFLHDDTVLKQTTYPIDALEEVAKEAKGVAFVFHITTGKSVTPIFRMCSSFRKLTRVTAYVKRFISNARTKDKTQRTVGPLTVQEIDIATKYWIKLNQASEFADEISKLEKKQFISDKSKILNLAPFLDDSGILRVGGRLRNANISENKKHPILLSAKHWTTSLILRQIHIDNFHAGTQLMLATLQGRYWIVNGRDIIRRYVHKCQKCARMKAAAACQMMGDLPAHRVTPYRAFEKCGVDYAGPFILKAMTPRSTKTYKAYVSLFICFSTRAIHMELVKGLDTQAFIAALRRFVSRRGNPTDMYSDCGTNFTGADKELRLLLQQNFAENHDELVANELSKRGIQWHFNPPNAPHFGGLWEAGVKSFKYHFLRLIGQVKLTYEEMNTVITEIEAVLNSRPLTALSSDPESDKPLTPGHFLIGDALTAIPTPNLTDLNENRLDRWQRGQAIVQRFWKRWSNEYLTRLQQRPKWAKAKENLKVGELVLIKDPNMPPLHWKLGRITEVHPGEDNKTRVVTIKTQTGILKRPIAKVCQLPLDTNS